MKKMYFPKSVNVGTTGYLAGEINEVAETSGSINRWLIRGCTLVEDLPKVEEKIEEKIEKKVIKKVIKKVTKKNIETK